MRAILDHELGHVVGLGHVQDPHELMYDEQLERTTFGPGDLQGLARVGSVACD
jgi:predicted Zn-dependent protease